MSGEKDKLEKEIINITESGNKVFPGNVLFNFKATNGFPLDFAIHRIIAEAGLAIGWVDFIEAAIVLQVLQPAIVVRVVGSDAHSHRVADGTRVPSLELAVAALAQRHFQVAFALEGGQARADIEHAGRGVLAEQRAVRAAQQVDLLQVQQVEHGLAGTAQEDVVEVNADAAFQAFVGRVVADAAHGHAGLACMQELRGDVGYRIVKM